jgi:hypothetical protein
VATFYSKSGFVKASLLLLWTSTGVHGMSPVTVNRHAVCEKSERARTARMIRELRSLGYQVQAIANPA